MIYTGRENIWDNERSQLLFRFPPSGVFSTEDPYIIKRMRELGHSEASKNDMVSIELCSGLNVDWRDKYKIAEEQLRQSKVELVALKHAYADLEKRLQDMMETVNIKVDTVDADDVIEEADDTFFEVNGELVRKDYPSIKGMGEMMKLKAFINTQNEDIPDLRKLNKEQTIAEVTKILKSNGLI